MKAQANVAVEARKALDVEALAVAIVAESARLDAVEAKANALDDAKAKREALNNVKQRREYIAVLATLREDERALFAECLQSWSVLVTPSDLYNMRDAALQFVSAALAHDTLRTAFSDFLKQFESKKKLSLSAQSFRHNVLRRVDAVSFYTGDTALRWAKGCAKALSVLDAGAKISGRADECTITLNRDSRMIKALEQAKIVNLSQCK